MLAVGQILMSIVAVMIFYDYFELYSSDDVACYSPVGVTMYVLYFAEHVAGNCTDPKYVECQVSNTKCKCII